MWKLKTIEAENLCAFRSLSYMLRQGVTTLIFGDNRDNDSQQSNGAGKSALLECIAVGITGSPLRNYTDISERNIEFFRGHYNKSVLRAKPEAKHRFGLCPLLFHFLLK